MTLVTSPAPHSCPACTPEVQDLYIAALRLIRSLEDPTATPLLLSEHQRRLSALRTAVYGMEPMIDAHDAAERG